MDKDGEQVFMGWPVKIATPDEAAAFRRDGERMITGEDGFRMVSYIDHKRGAVFVSHQFQALPQRNR